MRSETEVRSFASEMEAILGRKKREWENGRMGGSSMRRGERERGGRRERSEVPQLPFCSGPAEFNAALASASA